MTGRVVGRICREPVALIALFFALGGGAVGASASIHRLWGQGRTSVAGAQQQQRMFSIWVTGAYDRTLNVTLPALQRVDWHITLTESLGVCTQTTTGVGNELLSFSSKPETYRFLAKAGVGAFTINSRNPLAMGAVGIVWIRHASGTVEGCGVNESVPTTDCNKSVKGTARLYPVYGREGVTFDLLYIDNPYTGGSARQFHCPFLFGVTAPPLPLEAHWNDSLHLVTVTPITLGKLLSLGIKEEKTFPGSFVGHSPGVCGSTSGPGTTCTSNVAISWYLHVKRVA